MTTTVRPTDQWGNWVTTTDRPTDQWGNWVTTTVRPTDQWGNWVTTTRKQRKRPERPIFQEIVESGADTKW